MTANWLEAYDLNRGRFMNAADPKLPIKKESHKKRAYVKPQIQSEKLNSYGAICNGTTVGGRKASSSGPAFCNSAKLSS